MRVYLSREQGKHRGAEKRDLRRSEADFPGQVSVSSFFVLISFQRIIQIGADFL